MQGDGAAQRKAGQRAKGSGQCMQARHRQPAFQCFLFVREAPRLGRGLWRGKQICRYPARPVTATTIPAGDGWDVRLNNRRVAGEWKSEVEGVQQWHALLRLRWLLYTIRKTSSD